MHKSLLIAIFRPSTCIYISKNIKKSIFWKSNFRPQGPLRVPVWPRTKAPNILYKFSFWLRPKIKSITITYLDIIKPEFSEKNNLRKKFEKKKFFWTKNQKSFEKIFGKNLWKIVENFWKFFFFIWSDFKKKLFFGVWQKIFFSISGLLLIDKHDLNNKKIIWWSFIRVMIKSF